MNLEDLNSYVFRYIRGVRLRELLEAKPQTKEFEKAEDRDGNLSS